MCLSEDILDLFHSSAFSYGRTNYRGADKSLAWPGRKQATTTKICKPPRKKFRRLSVQPGLHGSNDLRVRRKMATFQFSRVGLRTYQQPCTSSGKNTHTYAGGQLDSDNIHSLTTVIVLMQIQIFWDMKQCQLMESYWPCTINYAPGVFFKELLKQGRVSWKSVQPLLVLIRTFMKFCLFFLPSSFNVDKITYRRFSQ